MDLKKLVILLVFLVVLPIPIHASSGDLTLLNSTIGLTSACSDYRLDYSGTLLEWANDIATIQASKVKEVYGSLSKMNISWRVNQTSAHTNQNCTYIPNGTNSSYKVCNPFTITQWNWVYEPIWTSDVIKGSIVNAVNTPELTAKSSSVYTQTSKDSYATVRFCGKYLYDKDTLSVAIDIIPKLMGVEYLKYTWCNVSYGYKKAGTVNTKQALTNYPIAINISYGSGGFESHSRTDFTDMIFVNASENEEIPYYCEANVSSSWIYCWVSDSWATTNGTQFYVYYGNNSITSSHSNGKNTFFAFDDFEDASINATLWNVTDAGAATVTESNGIVNVSGAGGAWAYLDYKINLPAGLCYMSNASIVQSTGATNAAWGWIDATHAQSFQWGYLTANVLNTRNYDGGEGVGYNWGALTGYRRLSFCRNTTSIDASVNYALHSLTDKVSTASLPFRFQELSTDGYADYLILRNYSFPEPDAATLGSEIANGAASWVRLYLNGTENNATYVYENSTNATATINVTGFWVAILRNGTVIANGTNSVQNINVTGAGYWNMTAYGQSNGTYTQNSTTWWMNITKANNPLSLANNYSWAFSYLNSTNITGYGNLTNATLYRNGTDVANPNYNLYGVGNYNFTYYTTGNANYSSNSTTSWLNISQAINQFTFQLSNSTYTMLPLTNYTPCDAFFGWCWGNNTEISAQYPSTIKVIWGCTAGAATATRDNVSITTENDTWITVAANASQHIYRLNCSGNSNYTTNQSVLLATINNGTPAINITFNTTSDTVMQGSIVNITCNKPAEITATLYNDTGPISNPLTFNASTIGTFNYTCNTTGNANYTSGTTNKSLTVALSGALIITQVLDEKTLTPLTFNLTVYNSSFSQTTNNIASYSNASVKGNLTIAISKSGYIQRNYYVNVQLNGTYSFTGYLLDSSSGVYVTYWATTSNNPAGEPNALINFLRFIGSSYVTTAQSQSDAQGKGTVYLDPYTIYEVNATTQDGSANYFLSSYNPNPSFILKITFGGATASNFSWFFTGTNWTLTPTDTYLKTNVSLINDTVSDANSSIEWYSLNLIYWNGTSLYFSNQTNPSGGSITVNLNYTSLNGTVIAQAQLKKTGFDLFTFNRTYIVWKTSSAIPDALAGLASSGLPIPVLALIAIFCAFGIAMISNRVIRTGGGIIYLAVLTIFGYYGLFGSNATITWQILTGLWLMEAGIIMYREVY